MLWREGCAVHALFASRSMARNRPSGVYSGVSSSMLSRYLHRSPVSEMTYRAAYAANLILYLNRVAAGTSLSVSSVIHSMMGRVNCSETGCNFSSRAYSILATVRGRSPSVTVNISRTLRAENRSGFSVNTNSRNVVFNFTYSRAPRLVPVPVSLTRGLAEGLARIEGGNALSCLHPSNGSRIAVRCISGGPIEISAVIVSARRSPRMARTRVRTSVVTDVVGPMVPTRLVSGSAGVFVGPANHFMVNKPRNSDNLAKEGVVMSACNNCSHRNNKTFDNGSPAGISHSTTCTTHCMTGGVMTTNLTAGYRVRLTCTVNMTRPMSLLIRAFNATAIRRSGVVRTMGGIFSLHPTTVVRTLSLEGPVCHSLTTCNRVNERSLNMT